MTPVQDTLRSEWDETAENAAATMADKIVYKLVGYSDEHGIPFGDDVARNLDGVLEIFKQVRDGWVDKVRKAIAAGDSDQVEDALKEGIDLLKGASDEMQIVENDIEQLLKSCQRWGCALHDAWLEAREQWVQLPVSPGKRADENENDNDNDDNNTPSLSKRSEREESHRA